MRYVIANWKQNKTLDEAVSWLESFTRLLENIDIKGVTPIICPPAPFLERMLFALKADFAAIRGVGRESGTRDENAAKSATSVELGIQDISPYADGAHTGFVGVNQVKQFCKYVLVGHSERQESRDLVMQKAEQCLSTNIVPIVCFKSSNDYKIIDGAIYALEDPDNISVGGVYRPKNLQDVVILVDTARKFFGQESVLVYGGSVNGENAQDLASIKNLNGVLVGNASLSPVEFADIVRKFSL